MWAEGQNKTPQPRLLSHVTLGYPQTARVTAVLDLPCAGWPCPQASALRRLICDRGDRKKHVQHSNHADSASSSQIRKAQNRIAQREFRLRKQVS